MPRWIPKPIWQGEDAFIIGGGSSLIGFDFDSLRGRNTIGCNHAFRLGEKVVKFCLFGDVSFFQTNKHEMEKSRVQIATCHPKLAPFPLHWLFQLDRVKSGLSKGPALGWNYSTGAAAVNLAIQLGAKRIFLLGFDMGRSVTDGKTHWHTHQLKRIEDKAFARHIKGFHAVFFDLWKFPGVEVINVTNGGSLLPLFKRMNFTSLSAILHPAPVSEGPVLRIATRSPLSCEISQDSQRFAPSITQAQANA